MDPCCEPGETRLYVGETPGKSTKRSLARKDGTDATTAPALRDAGRGGGRGGRTRRQRSARCGRPRRRRRPARGSAWAPAATATDRSSHTKRACRPFLHIHHLSMHKATIACRRGGNTGEAAQERAILNEGSSPRGSRGPRRLSSARMAATGAPCTSPASAASAASTALCGAERRSPPPRGVAAFPAPPPSSASPLLRFETFFLPPAGLGCGGGCGGGIRTPVGGVAAAEAASAALLLLPTVHPRVRRPYPNGCGAPARPRKACPLGTDRTSARIAAVAAAHPSLACGDGTKNLKKQKQPRRQIMMERRAKHHHSRAGTTGIR